MTQPPALVLTWVRPVSRAAHQASPESPAVADQELPAVVGPELQVVADRESPVAVGPESPAAVGQTSAFQRLVAQTEGRSLRQRHTPKPANPSRLKSLLGQVSCLFPLVSAHYAVLVIMLPRRSEITFCLRRGAN